MTPDAVNRIQRYVEAGMQPVVTSVLADAHVFTWDTHGVEDADFAVVNRNGNFSRAVQTNGVWQLYRNLGRAGQCFAPEHWEETQVTGPCLRECAQKMWLVSRDEEKLTFLPKELTPPKSRRLLICRDQLFKLFARPDDGVFKLELGGATSPDFTGKPWDSQAAVDWAVARCSGADAPKSAEAMLAHAQIQQAVGSMESLDCFGMF